MDSQTPAKADSLEVTGVSRSGRVRKKSSKLVDFQSPDDIDASRAKRPMPSKSANTKTTAIAITTPVTITPSIITSPSIDRSSHVTLQGTTTIANQSPEIRSPPCIKLEHELEMVSPMAVNVNIDGVTDAGADTTTLNDMDIHSGNDNDDVNDDDDDDDDEDPNALLIDTTVKKSAYMTEKSTKKKIFQNGKFVSKKPQRKDKGKSRFTAYMLWAKDVRNEMLYTCPDMDFSTISRRLGEMWANVPSNEKYNWRRRAKRLAAKNKEKPTKINIPVPKPPPAAVGVTSKFLNRNASQQIPRKNKPIGTQAEKKSTITGGGDDVVSVPIQTQRATTTHNNKTSPAGNAATKLSGTSPVDVAAHLKLLGDSLTIIGQRLKEHEGQIAVSGSLSVLLDSLLCSVAPLMCLAVQIPEIGNETTDEIKRTMARTLDNIAYVMPGL